MDIGTKIRTLRTAKNLSQAELAQLSGVSQAFISAIETGRSSRFEQQLLDTLGYTPEMESLLQTLAHEEPESA